MRGASTICAPDWQADIVDPEPEGDSPAELERRGCLRAAFDLAYLDHLDDMGLPPHAYLLGEEPA